MTYFSSVICKVHKVTRYIQFSELALCVKQWLKAVIRQKAIGMQNSSITRYWVASGLLSICLAFAGLIGFSLPVYTASDPVTESHQGRSLD